MNYEIIYGRHPVYEALKAGKRKIKKILIAKKYEGKIIDDIIALAKNKNLAIEFIDSQKLVGYSKNHQGVVAYVSPLEYFEFGHLSKLAGNKKNSTVCVLDEVEDPHNLGSIIRSAVCFGVDAIIVPEKSAAGISAGTVKASAGAIEYVPIVKVVNIAQTIKKLKENGYWIYGAEMTGGVISKTKFENKIAIVIGSEGYGLRRLTKENCDFLIKIPITPEISSLNAAMSASIIFYEISRQKVS